MATKQKRKARKTTETRSERQTKIASVLERAQHVLSDLVAAKDELEQLRSDAWDADLPGESGAFALIVESLGNSNQTLDNQIEAIQRALDRA